MSSLHTLDSPTWNLLRICSSSTFKKNSVDLSSRWLAKSILESMIYSNLKLSFLKSETKVPYQILSLVLLLQSQKNLKTYLSLNSIFLVYFSVQTVSSMSRINPLDLKSKFKMKMVFCAKKLQRNKSSKTAYFSKDASY